MTKIAIIGYTLLHGFFFVCNNCMLDKRFWMPYWVADEIVGGGVLLWYITYRYSVKYKVAAWFTFLFSVFREAWNICCYIMGINTSDTNLTSILFIALLIPIYYTLFVPNGRLSKFLDYHLKAFNI